MAIEADNSLLMKEIGCFLKRSSGATIFHMPEWNLIVKDVFNTRFLYLVFLKGGQMCGAMPCHIIQGNSFSSICYSPPRMWEVPYGGPVAAGPVRNDICRRLVRRAGHLQPGIIVSIFNSPENTDWVSTSQAKARRFESAYVDLAGSLEEIWKSSLDGKRRNMIRKAQKSGVDIEIGGPEKVAPYYGLVKQMTERANIVRHPMEYYKRILECFSPKHMARLYLAHHQGKLLAGGIFLIYGRHCYYWHGASATNVQKLGQGELLQWEVIQWAKESGCKWYDLVGVDRDHLPNIAEFKMGFADKLVPFDHVQYGRLVNRVIRRLAYRII